MILVVGLTGGIGSGKSTVADLFAARGAPVVDADAISRDLVEPGRPALAAIVAQFGTELLDADGRLDRRRLREAVFEDPKARTRLEAILHPRVRATIRERIQALDGSHPYCIVASPLLIESAMQDLVDRILVVDAPEALQLKRAASRDGVTESQVRAILATQADRQERRAWADDILENAGGLDELRAGVEALDRRYRQQAQSASPPP